jgi:hypothetical protein
MHEPWSAAVAGYFGAPVRVLGSRPQSGGYVACEVWLVELDPPGGPRSVVWKRTTSREVAALRAVAAVPGVPGSLLLADSGDAEQPGAEQPGAERPDAEQPWVLMRHHPGTPLVAGEPVPDQVYEVLARVHGWYLGRPPPGLPVVDPAFWRRLCLDVALPAVRGAAARAPHPAYPRAAEALLAWAGDERMRAALTALPATLAHGDLHRGNILSAAGAAGSVAGAAGSAEAVVIDWGNARIAPGGLDLAVLAEQGGVDEDRYHRRLAELTARPVGTELTGLPVSAELRVAEREWARATGYVQYLGFAADHLGPDRVGEMIGLAGDAFDRLGPALNRL